MKTLVADMRTIGHLLLVPVRGDTHQDRLESFYRAQANDYDSFRERMLHGRRELIESLVFPDQGVWVDLGCGTGKNLEFAGDKISSLTRIELVDLSDSMLKVAADRIAGLRRSGKIAATAGTQVRCCDATATPLADGCADVVSLSYSLTMIPDWFSAIDEAYRLLKVGGTIAVVDFHVSRKHPARDRVRHGWLTRTGWPIWFGTDNVNLSPDHLPMLQKRFHTESLHESRGSIPYLPLVRVPHYRFVGTKV
ncbi:class I SAM-dependent methyltransferase [Neorhodopirellula lusitana]|uniref:class I SAM-dependent methyltransferase n=1 Tax=Neorhodopirellula lusitana TaxID=445327 RepID=UPI00384C8FDC